MFEPVVEKFEHENLDYSTLYSSNCDFVNFKSQILSEANTALGIPKNVPTDLSRLKPNFFEAKL